MKELIREIGLALAPEKADDRAGQAGQAQPSLSDIAQPVTVRTVITGEDCRIFYELYASKRQIPDTPEGLKEIPYFGEKIYSGAVHFTVQQLEDFEPEYQGPEPDMLNYIDACQARKMIKAEGSPIFIDPKSLYYMLDNLIHCAKHIQSIRVEGLTCLQMSEEYELCIRKVARANQHVALKIRYLQDALDHNFSNDIIGEIRGYGGDLYQLDLTDDWIS